MLYKSNEDIYIFANNKYYKVEVVKDNLVPAKEAKYKIENKFEITYQDAIEHLKKDKRGIKLQNKLID